MTATPEQRSPLVTEPLGAELRRERQLRQISIEELAQTTRISIRMLQHIENDRFEALPGEVFTKGFLRAYAGAVGLDPDQVVARYSHGRRAQELVPAPITAITPPERGRRFGIALALVILLILFTLALSIVLRPRHRETPVELSLREPPCHVLPSTLPRSCSGASTTATPIASSRC